MKDEIATTSATEPKRKPYREPKLVELGSVEALTGTGGHSGADFKGVSGS